MTIEKKCPYCEAESDKISKSDNPSYKYKCLKCGNYFILNRERKNENDKN